MSILVSDWIRAHGPKSMQLRGILLALANRADDEGVCWPSVALIGRESGTSERNARRLLRVAEAEGWIRTKLGRGRKRSSIYTVLMIENPAGLGLEHRDQAEKTGQTCPVFDAQDHTTAGGYNRTDSAIKPDNVVRRTVIETKDNVADKSATARNAPRGQIAEAVDERDQGHPEPEILPPPNLGAAEHQPHPEPRPRAENRQRVAQPSLDLGDSPATAPSAAPAAFSVAKAIFEQGVRLLTSHGVPEPKARRMIGRWRKSFPDFAILGALDSCSREQPVDPVSWITATLRHRGDGGNIINLNPKGSGHEQNQHHPDFSRHPQSGPAYRAQRGGAYGPASQILAAGRRLGYLD